MKNQMSPEVRAVKVTLVLLTVVLASRPSEGSVPPKREEVNQTSRGGPACEVELSVPLRSPKLLVNGSLWDPQRKELYPPGTYWKWDVTFPKKREAYLGCPCKLGRPCLRKCCPIGRVFHEDEGCVPSSQGEGEFRLPVSNDNGSVSFSVLASENFYLLFGNTCYYGHYRLRPELYEDNSYFVRASNGSLAMPAAGVASLWTDEFCVDHDAVVGEPRAFLCLPLFKRMKVAVPSIAFPVFLLISAPIACCTLIAYLLLRESRRSMESRLRVFLLFNVFYAFLFQACVMIYASELEEFQTLTLGIGSQFFSLAAGCWISVMLFWLSLSSWITKESTDNNLRKKTIYYCVYSWGIPLLATLLAAVKLKGGVLPYNEVNPGYAEARAWIGIFQGALMIFFGTDAILFLLNFILLVFNVIRIHQFNEEVSVLGDHAVFAKHKETLWNHKKRFILCFILLAIYCVFRSVEAAFWMVSLPEPGLRVVDIVDSVAEVSICTVLAVADGIFLALKEKILSLLPLDSLTRIWTKENVSSPKTPEGFKS